MSWTRIITVQQEMDLDKISSDNILELVKDEFMDMYIKSL